MAQRWQDWWNQAQRDLTQAADSRRQGRHEWACFAAHQAAEKAVKALHLAHSQEAHSQEASGHSIVRLLADLPTPAPDRLTEAGILLDSYYVPTRYPNGHGEGAPFEHYGPIHSELGLRRAGDIHDFVRQALAEG